MRLHCAIFTCSLSIAAIAAGCASQNSDAAMQTNTAANSPGESRTDVAVLTVHGMGCPQCANNVDLQLMRVQGVQAVTINMGTGKVYARLSQSSRPTREQLAAAIERTGFTLVNIEMPE